MVAVFAIFATLGLIDFKMMGVGLAVAVLLDATIVRAVLLPAYDEAPRRLELVPAPVARMAAAPDARAPTRGTAHRSHHTDANCRAGAGTTRTRRRLTGHRDDGLVSAGERRVGLPMVRGMFVSVLAAGVLVMNAGLREFAYCAD